MVNVEADSVNAAVLAPSTAPGTPAFDAFIKEVAREMTVKAGQKCTAIRRVLAPADRAGAVAEALSARLAKITLGDPRNEATRMGPLVNRAQQAGVLQGIGKLANEATIICGGSQAPKLGDIDGSKSAFVSPTLLKVDNASKAQAAHETEIFGPAATIIPYKDEAESFALVALGGGSLVVSVFGDDLDFLARAVTELGASNGRVLAVDPSVADGHSGHGIVMPQCHHGGPGRAGNGEELGGLNGLRLYHQRVAVQGSAALVNAVSANAISFG
jgi:3,4-dehydroadipyl-CoA semialdehyde dehydrogenase